MPLEIVAKRCGEEEASLFSNEENYPQPVGTTTELSLRKLILKKGYRSVLGRMWQGGILKGERADLALRPVLMYNGIHLKQEQDFGFSIPARSRTRFRAIFPVRTELEKNGAGFRENSWIKIKNFANPVLVRGNSGVHKDQP